MRDMQTLAFPDLGQRKHKSPDRLRRLMGLIGANQVPAIANDLDLCSRNPREYLTPVLLLKDPACLGLPIRPT